MWPRGTLRERDESWAALGRLAHQWLGQVQMYVNCFGRHEHEQAERDLRLAAKELGDDKD
jgi:hypothetical protein